MSQKEFFRIRLYFTAAVAVLIWTLLAWDYFHGGVPSHHLLANENLPEISNGWGAVLLPVLTWVLLYRMHKRAFSQTDPSKILKREVYGFAAALAFGIILSAFFTLGYPEYCSYMLMGLLAVAFFVPVYRAGCLLGFVLGMSYTFGAVLPTLIGSVLCLASFVAYKLIRTAILYMGAKVMLLASVRK